MHKGKKVYVEGYLKTRNWEDTAWVKRYKTEIVADNVILLSSAGGESGNYSAPQANSSSFDTAPEEPRVKKSKPKAEEEIAIEDIPF